MDYQIVWSEPALQALQRIYAYIAQDSQRYATAQIRKLIFATARLSSFPLSGKIYAEGSGGFRELIVPPYRLVYEVKSVIQQVEILNVFHGRRNVPG